MSTIPPLSDDAVVVVAHAMPDWPPGCYRILLDVDGRLLTCGRDPHKAAALRLLEEGYTGEHMLALRYADNSRPMAHAAIVALLGGDAA